MGATIDVQINHGSPGGRDDGDGGCDGGDDETMMMAMVVAW